LIDARNVKSITKEARDYLASAEGTRYVTAAGLLLESYLGKIMGNFFLQINKPSLPTKMFSNKKEAIEWLTQYTKEG